MFQFFSKLPKSKQALIIAGIGAISYYSYNNASSKKKVTATTPTTPSAAASTKPKRPSYGDLWKRLKQIMQIIFPKFWSRELLHLSVLSFFLISRTVLSIKVAEITGQVASHLVQAQWENFVKGVLYFGLIGIPAAVVNSALKYETSMLALCFRQLLTKHVNQKYISGVSFYKASNLPQLSIDNIDQRVTVDIERFSEDIANLYTSIFKPVLDVVLNTIRLSSVMGPRGPMLLLVYYLVLGQVKLRLMPDFKKLTEVQSELEGEYRTCHSRLIANSEEIAFFDGAARERGIVGRIFDQLFDHCTVYAQKRGLIGILDQYLLKYASSIVGYIILCLPVFFPTEGQNGATSSASSSTSVGAHTRDFVRNRQLLMDLAQGVGTLLSTTNKVASLAGSTTRVCEVLDAINSLNESGTKTFEIRQDNNPTASSSSSSATEVKGAVTGITVISGFDATQIKFLQEWRIRGAEIRAKRDAKLASTLKTTYASGDGTIKLGERIEFKNCTIVSPDGRLLVKDLNVNIPPGNHTLVTGPNGCGKSSLFRVIGELWPLYSGELIKPNKADIMFVAQKPYQVLGSLRDQLIYPDTVQEMKAKGITDDDLVSLLALVDPQHHILNQWKLDEERQWFHAFSGGQKQRVAAVRIMYHRPLYAILDECTSAVSEDVEGLIYRCFTNLGITIFTVSHRPSLQVYHQYQLRLDGFGHWTYLSADQLPGYATSATVTTTTSSSDSSISITPSSS